VIFVCFRNSDEGETYLDPPPYPVRIGDHTVDGPDGEGDTTVVIDVERVTL